MNVAPRPATIGFEALDACHQQIIENLKQLTALAAQVAVAGVDAAAQQQAAAIEAFFSGTSRQHHLDEEKRVFAPLLAGGEAELVALVRVLQQDHGWIEENWLELAPQLRAMAQGNNWFDGAEFQHNVEVFSDLCLGHVELEEKMIYPQARTQAALSGIKGPARVPQ